MEVFISSFEWRKATRPCRARGSPPRHAWWRWRLHPRSVTWPLKSYLSKRKVSFQPAFFRGNVKLRGCIFRFDDSFEDAFKVYPPPSSSLYIFGTRLPGQDNISGKATIHPWFPLFLRGTGRQMRVKIANCRYLHNFINRYSNEYLIHDRNPTDQMQVVLVGR